MLPLARKYGRNDCEFSQNGGKCLTKTPWRGQDVNDRNLEKHGVLQDLTPPTFSEVPPFRRVPQTSKIVNPFYAVCLDIFQGEQSVKVKLSFTV